MTNLVITVSFALLVAAFLPTGNGQDDPILPKDYRNIIKQGFATNYFKVLPEKTEKKYQDKNIDDVYKKGFRNLRLRARADLYTAPYDQDANFAKFLDMLEKVVDKCLQKGVAPIISWINHHAEAYPTNEEKQNYISWWTLVATRLKDKDYRLSFNLFTELGIDAGCKTNCGQTLRENTAKYTEWTKEVVAAIRGINGNNKKRIIILTSPKKTATGLSSIDSSIYKDDPYMMAEFHLYASGPNKKADSAKYWDGGDEGKKNVEDSIQPAVDWTKKTGIYTYFGAWMAEDNTDMALNEDEIKSFARFFVKTLKANGIPWSINVLDRYYDTKTSTWLGTQTIEKTEKQTINFKRVLNAIINNM